MFKIYLSVLTNSFFVGGVIFSAATLTYDLAQTRSPKPLVAISIPHSTPQATINEPAKPLTQQQKDQIIIDQVREGFRTGKYGTSH